MSLLSPAERKRGVVAFSSGNHAQAIALSARLLGMPSVIVMPNDAPAVKIAATRGYGAEVVLYEWDTLDIVLAKDDRARFASIHDLARDVKLHGYYGGIRLIKATIKRFVEYCQAQNLKLHDRNFSIRYHTNIPQQVGMAGSSAIIVIISRLMPRSEKVEPADNPASSVQMPESVSR